MAQESIKKDRVVRAIFRHMMGPERFAWRSDMAAHLPTLYLLARHWGQKNIVELGVNDAFSTIGLLAGAVEADCPMVSYDIVHCGANLWKNIGLAPDPTLKWEFRQMDSLKAAQQWKDGSIGLWFLDTSHKLEPVRQELSAWLPKLDKDGVMCGHDYYLHEQIEWAQESGVKTAVDEFASLHRDRFQLQVLPHDHGLWILWPYPPVGPELQAHRRCWRQLPPRVAVPCDECGMVP